MILLDTSGLLAAIDESQTHHRECAAILSDCAPPLFLSPFVLAELDYLVMLNLGPQSQSALLGEITRGAYQLEPFAASDIVRAQEICDKYADLQIGLADASIVVLAERHGTTDLLTLDLKRFRSMRIDRRKRFRIFPFDRTEE